MLYNDYSWNIYEANNPKIIGEFDSTDFNKNEGHEVLYFINKMAKILDLKDKEYGIKMEILIHEYLPSHIINQIQAKEWINHYLNRY